MTWRLEAACAGMRPVLFHPVTSDGERHAKAVCARCPSREACLSHAIDAGEHDGVWGGLTAKQRWQLDRRQPVRYCVECNARYHPAKAGPRVETCSTDCALDRRRRMTRVRARRNRVTA